MRIFASKSVSTLNTEVWEGSWAFGSVSLPEGSYVRVLGGSLFISQAETVAQYDLSDAVVGVWGGAVPPEFYTGDAIGNATPLAYASVLKQSGGAERVLKSGLTHFALSPRVGSLSGELVMGWTSNQSAVTSMSILTFTIDLEVEIVKASTASLQAMILESC